MKHSKYCVEGNRDFFQMYAVIFVRAFEWLSPSEDFCFSASLLTEHAFIATVFLVFVFPKAFAFPIFFAEYSFSYSLSCLKLNSIFHGVFCTHLFLYTNAIFFFVLLRTLLNDYFEVIWGYLLFLLAVWIVHYFEWWIDSEASILLNLVWLDFPKEYFFLCSFCLKIPDFDFESFLTC